MLTSLTDVPPAKDPAGSAVGENAAAACQTHRLDLVIERDRRSQPEQSRVVRQIGEHNFSNSPGHSRWTSRQVQLPQDNTQSFRAGKQKYTHRRKLDEKCGEALLLFVRSH